MGQIGEIFGQIVAAEYLFDLAQICPGAHKPGAKTVFHALLETDRVGGLGKPRGGSPAAEKGQHPLLFLCRCPLAAA